MRFVQLAPEAIAAVEAADPSSATDLTLPFSSWNLPWILVFLTPTYALPQHSAESA